MFPIEGDAWHEWWRSFRANMQHAPAESSDDQQMRCFVTGALVTPASTHPKISGLAGVGGLSMGDALVSFDKDAFGSYGLDQGRNGAISEAAASGYAGALNEVMRNHGVRVGKAIVAHWFSRSVAREDDPLVWLDDGGGEAELLARRRADALLHAIRRGERADLATNIYYALTVSGAAGRVMVRDWMEGQFDSLVANVGKWFDDLTIVRRDGQGLAKDPKFLAVVGALARDLSEIPAPTAARLWRVAANAEGIPGEALAKALHRGRAAIVAAEPANHARMGLLKAFHVRRGDLDMKPQLNEEHPSPAYHCGRLMSVMASIQYHALGDVGAGLVQRYYAAASATPALVLGRLARTSQFHLNKLDPGLAHWFDSKVAAIWNRIGESVPVTLSLEEQSLFALGYYQQMAADRAKPSSDPKEESNA